MTNIYDFLRRVLIDTQGGAPGCVNITAEERQWLEHYLASEENELHFKSRQVGEQDGMPLTDQHFAIKGNDEEIFCLLTEAAIQNGNFSRILVGAAHFIQDHVPTCRHCNRHHQQWTCPVPGNWEFEPIKVLPNGPTSQQ